MLSKLTKNKTLLIILSLLTVFICLIILLIAKTDFNPQSLLDFIASFSVTIEKNPVLAFIAFFLFYTAVCSIPFPFVSIITLAIGYLFGFTLGFIITSFGSALGGLIMFSLSRRFLNKKVVQQAVKKFPKVEPFLQSDDLLVATSIRFIPGMPFFLPSLIFSMTQISAFKFYLSTQLGLLITMAIFINAGATLSSLSTTGANLYSPKLIASMLLIALLPLMLKAINKYRHNNKCT